MNQTNPPPSEVKETVVVGSIRLQEIPFKVKSPVFEDIVVKVPKFIDEVIKVPVGFDTIVNQLALDISNAIFKQVETIIREKLDKAIDERINTIRVPKIVEDLVIKNREVEVERVVYRDVDVDRVIYKDKEVINPVLVDREIINAIIIDKTVVNSIVTDQKITNSIITDVPVERAVIRERVLDVVHPRFLNLKGEPE